MVRTSAILALVLASGLLSSGAPASAASAGASAAATSPAPTASPEKLIVPLKGHAHVIVTNPVYAGYFRVQPSGQMQPNGMSKGSYFLFFNVTPRPFTEALAAEQWQNVPLHIDLAQPDFAAMSKVVAGGGDPRASRAAPTATAEPNLRCTDYKVSATLRGDMRVARAFGDPRSGRCLFEVPAKPHEFGPMSFKVERGAISYTGGPVDIPLSVQPFGKP